MHYVFYCEDTPNSSEKRRSVRPAHIQRLQSLKDEGRLLVAGPLLTKDDDSPAAGGVRGSLIIAEFDNIEEAKAWMAADPYVTAEVYANITVLPYKVML